MVEPPFPFQAPSHSSPIHPPTRSDSLTERQVPPFKQKQSHPYPESISTQQQQPYADGMVEPPLQFQALSHSSPNQYPPPHSDSPTQQQLSPIKQKRPLICPESISTHQQQPYIEQQEPLTAPITKIRRSER